MSDLREQLEEATYRAAAIAGGFGGEQIEGWVDPELHRGDEVRLFSPEKIDGWLPCLLILLDEEAR